MTDRFNESIIITAEDGGKEKGKKGGGIKAIGALLQRIGDFQDQIQVAIDAQDIQENKTDLEAFNQQITAFWHIIC